MKSNPDEWLAERNLDIEDAAHEFEGRMTLLETPLPMRAALAWILGEKNPEFYGHY